MPVPPQGARRFSGVQRDTGEQPGNGLSDRLAKGGTKSDTGRFALLLIDNTTKRATRVNFRPLTLEMILRSNRHDRPLIVDYLLMQLVEAAQRLWPEIIPESTNHRPLTGYPLRPRRTEEESKPGPFVPRWRRYLSHEDDDGGI